MDAPRRRRLLPGQDRGGKMNPPILEADKLLAGANLPTYTQAMGALLALAKEIGSMPNVDQHQVFKAWVMLDRYSINSKGN